MSRQTGFDPMTHGFRFANGFEWAWLWARRKIYFGLCGGMCRVALRYWREARAIPPIESPPEQGSPLYRLLVREQALSMGPMVLARLARRVLADQRVNDRLTRQSLPDLLDRIDRGEPTLLVIVRSQGFDQPTQNHQVLCVGYDEDARLSRLRLDIYDPIYPCQPVALHLELANLDGGLHVTHTHGDLVRGFFTA